MHLSIGPLWAGHSTEMGFKQEWLEKSCCLQKSSPKHIWETPQIYERSSSGQMRLKLNMAMSGTNPIPLIAPQWSIVLHWAAKCFFVFSCLFHNNIYIATYFAVGSPFVSTGNIHCIWWWNLGEIVLRSVCHYKMPSSFFYHVTADNIIQYLEHFFWGM